MKWLISILFFATLSAPVTHAQTELCDTTEASCMLGAAWTAALILPDEKRERLAPAFLEIAAMSEDPELVSVWEKRFDRPATSVAEYPDYGWQKAEPLIQTGGVDHLIQVAKQRSEPLSFGRADALLSAGKRLREIDPNAAYRLNQAMMEMLLSASSFEKPNLAHAAAELAMVRCDADMLSQALAMTDAPDNLRYALWKARLSGNGLALLERIRSIDNDQDTREVRRVLDGYRAILELGYCAVRKSEIGG